MKLFKSKAYKQFGVHKVAYTLSDNAHLIHLQVDDNITAGKSPKYAKLFCFLDEMKQDSNDDEVRDRCPSITTILDVNDFHKENMVVTVKFLADNPTEFSNFIKSLKTNHILGQEHAKILMDDYKSALQQSDENTPNKGPGSQ